MKFEFSANIFFEAENIDDAFEKLERHFKHLKEGNVRDYDNWFFGKMDITRDLKI